uniref:Uncharacterized protein n=1 Tax=Knipowitschia caucasica TaxID=637954 RepID=A0AAV2MLF2_KNICA
MLPRDGSIAQGHNGVCRGVASARTNTSGKRHRSLQGVFPYTRPAIPPPSKNLEPSMPQQAPALCLCSLTVSTSAPQAVLSGAEHVQVMPLRPHLQQTSPHLPAASSLRAAENPVASRLTEAP